MSCYCDFDFWILEVVFFYSYEKQILVGDLFDDPCNKKEDLLHFLLCSILIFVSQINTYLSIFLHGKIFKFFFEKK